MSRLNYYLLEYGYHLVNATIGNTASHDNHEKINSGVSFAFLQLDRNPEKMVSFSFRKHCERK